MLQQGFASSPRSLGEKPRKKSIEGRASPAGGRAKGRTGQSNHGADQSSPLARVRDAIARFEAARRRLRRVPEDAPRSSLNRALQAATRAEDDLIEAIGRATPIGGDGDHPRAYLHDDGRLFVSLPDGMDLEIDGHIERILVIPSARQACAKNA